MQLPEDIANLVQAHDKERDDEKFARELKAAQQRRNNEIMRLTAENAKIESILSGVRPMEVTGRTDLVLRIIRENGGSAQIDHILTEMHKVHGLESLTKEMLYHLLVGGKNSLVNREKLTRTKIGRSVIYTIGPKAAIDVDVEPYLHEMEQRTDISQHLEIATRFATAIAYYTEKVLWPRNNGARVQPTRLYELLRRDGLIGSIEHLIRSVESAGYHGLLACGYEKLIIENIVCDHPDVFASDVVARSKQRTGR